MPILLLLCALAMPVVAAVSQSGAFGPDNGVISARYPTLLVAAGYAFSIWGVIFVLDLVFAVWQLGAGRREDPVLGRIRPLVAAGFALTTAWMPIFSLQLFGLSLVVIWAALGCLLYGAIVSSRASAPSPWQAWLPISLHAGWLSLAVFLNTAQVIVAYRLLSTDRMLTWSLVLFGLTTVLLGVANQVMRGNRAYVAAALWGLVGVYVKQSQATLPGADTAAVVAIVAAILLVVQTAWWSLRRRV